MTIFVAALAVAGWAFVATIVGLIQLLPGALLGPEMFVNNKGLGGDRLNFNTIGPILGVVLVVLSLRVFKWRLLALCIVLAMLGIFILPLFSQFAFLRPHLPVYGFDGWVQSDVGGRF